MANLFRIVLGIIFLNVAIVMIVHFCANRESKSPIEVSIMKTEIASDGNGVPHFIVSGIIQNHGDKTYNVPNIALVAYRTDGNQINESEQFNPPVVSLDAGARAGFVYTMRAPAVGIKQIVVKLKK